MWGQCGETSACKCIRKACQALPSGLCWVSRISKPSLHWCALQLNKRFLPGLNAVRPWTKSPATAYRFFYARALVSEAHCSEEWRSFVEEDLQLCCGIINVWTWLLRESERRFSNARRLTVPSPAVCPPWGAHLFCRLWIMQTAIFWYSPLMKTLRNDLSHMPLGGTLGTWQSLGFIHYAWAASPELVLFFFLLFLVKCNYLFIFTPCLLQPVPALLAAELCHPHVRTAARSGQPSGPTSASRYHSPAAQRLPQLLGWQPHHSTRLVKNVSCIRRNCDTEPLEILKS